MPASAPLVSLCVPTRNRAAALNDALESICGQDYSPLDILISDNHSDDDTELVAREWMARDPRIRYVRHERNIGLHGNHNFCFDEARGDLICICHDHDRRDRHIVSEYVSFLAAHPRVGIVCTDWELIDDDDRQIGVRDHGVPAVTPGLEYIGQTMRAGRSSVGIPGAMVRRAALGESRFELDAPIGFGDFPVWFRVAETWDVGHIPKRLWSWRQNEVSHSARAIESIARDYDVNLGSYCDAHLMRWPEHGELVRRWRASIKRYLFWALCYEVALHFRDRGADRAADHERSLFEIMDYRLTPEQFESALSQMSRYRSGVTQRLAAAALRTLIAVRLTRPLGWASRHHAALRTVLGLK
jgi:glycosyltransferase involved in cell wall biosynthesis